jgi:uncharacterized Zn-binding protein involved in type VI secretion
MPEIVRETDADDAGHIPVEFSPDVKVEEKFVFRHDDKDTVAHVVNSGTALNATAYNVFVNNKPVVLKGDLDTGGNVKINAASTVFVGS